MNSFISKFLNVTSYVAFVFATLWSLYLVFFGLDLTDSFFYCCKFLYNNKVSVFVSFTQFIMRCGNWFFGDYVIGYRLINWLFFYLAYLCIYLFVISENRGFKKYGLWVLSLAIVLMTILNTNVFSGESISAFFLISSFISLYKAIHSNRLWLIGLSISIALCVLTQFPNIVLIPILLVTSWLICAKKSDYWYVVLSIILGFLLYVLVNSIIFGGLRAFQIALTNTFAETTIQGDGADHSIALLFSEYLHSLKDIFSYIKYLAVISILPLFAFYTKKRYMLIVIAGVFIVSLLLFIKIRVKVVSDVFNYFLTAYFYASIFIAIFSIVVLGLLRHDLKLIGLGIIPLCVSVCAPAGSDSGLCLLGIVLFAFIPWFVYVFQKMLITLTKKELGIWILSLFGLSVCAFVYVREGLMIVGIALLVFMLVALWFVPYLKLNIVLFNGETSKSGNKEIVLSYTIWAILALSFSIYAKTQTSFEWVPMKEFTCQHKFPQMKYIWTNPRSCQYVENVMKDYYSLVEKGKTIAFFGQYSYVFSYLSHVGVIPGVEFTQTDIPRDIKALEQFIEDKDIIVFLIPHNPARQVITVDAYPNTRMMLEQHGYTCENKDNKYAIFYPAK